MDQLSVCNRDVIEYIKRNNVDLATKYMIDKYKPKTSYRTLQKDLSRLHKTFQQLNKSKSRATGKANYEAFMDKLYEFPLFSPERSEKSHSDSGLMIQEDQIFTPSDNVHLKAETYKSVAGKLAKELFAEKTNKLAIQEELNLVVEEKDELNTELNKSLSIVDSQRKNVKRTANREAYWRDKCQKLENNETVENEIETLTAQLVSLKGQIVLKNEEIRNLRETIDELNIDVINLRNVEEVALYNENSNSYIPELHACVYSLLDCHVSCENVSKVIESVLKLCNKKADKLPSVSTVNNWSVERALIARRHITETCDSENTTLHTDEASKYGSKWGAFATRDNEGNYMLLGLRDMATKSSSDTLETFKEILSDINAASETETDVGKKILSNIKNTMSDRAATECKFNDLLKDYRESILPDVVDNYENLSEDSKQAVSSMNNFFCGLHTLVHMADVSQKSLYETEKAHFDGDIPIDNPSFAKSGQAGTVRLVFTACKAFARRGDQKNGCHQAFRVFINQFLKDNGLLSLPLQPLRGNRFNILFSNAGHVYFFRHKMTEYLKKTNTMNGLLKSVLKDLEVPFFIAGCKALGLISKLITTPLWRVIENKDITISLMNERYLTLLQFLENSCQDLDSFIKGDLVLYNDISIKKDKVYESLVTSSEEDGSVVLILSVILPALSKLVKQQYGDHLPGGAMETIDPLTTASVDKHNKFPERVFSYVDHVLGSKPNVKTLALESQITFSLNKTSEWLESKDNSNQIIIDSRREVKTERQRFKQREQFILARRIEKQQEQFLLKQQIERKRIEKLEKETADMLFYGLWQSPAEVEKELNEIKTKGEKEEALKTQLRFRKNVFAQKCDDNPSVFAFSKVVNGRRVPLSINELKNNVLCLIGNAYDTPPPEQPHLLVGKNIEHKWFVDGEPKWYTGTAISQVPGFPEWFNVKYDNDIAIYTAKLGEDYKAGDVIIKA